MIPKIGKYRNIGSSEMDIHLEQIKVEDQEYKEDVQWYVCDLDEFTNIKSNINILHFNVSILAVMVSENLQKG